MSIYNFPLFIIAAIALKYFQPESCKNLSYSSFYTNFISRDTLKNPTVSIERVTVNPAVILFIRDTSEMNALNALFQKDYSELFAFISQNGLRPGKVMAFYLNHENPISLEVAVEVDKTPDKLTGRIKSRITEGGDAVVAHYKGPYEEMKLPYDEITKWLKENAWAPRGLPFEVYLNDPTVVKDKYELKTDIYQLLK